MNRIKNHYHNPKLPCPKCGSMNTSMLIYDEKKKTNLLICHVCKAVFTPNGKVVRDD